MPQDPQKPQGQGKDPFESPDYNPFETPQEQAGPQPLGQGGTPPRWEDDNYNPFVPETAPAAVAPPKVAPPSGPDQSDWSAGWRSGVAGVSTSVGEFLNLVGLPELAKSPLETGEEWQKASEAYAPKVPNLRDVHSVSDAIDFAQYQVGSGLVSSAPSLVGGAGLSAVAKGLQYGPLALKAAAAVGAAIPSYIQNTGDVYEELKKMGHADRKGLAAVLGIPIALFDMMTPGEIVDKIVNKQVAKAAARGVLGEALHIGLKEAGTEGVQEATQYAGIRIPTGEPMNFPDAAWRIANAAAAGGVTGLATGGAEGALTSGDTRHGPPKVVDPVTHEPPPGPPGQPTPNEVDTRQKELDKLAQQEKETAEKKAKAKSAFLKAVGTWGTLSADQRKATVPGLAADQYDKKWKDLSDEAKRDVRKAFGAAAIAEAEAGPPTGAPPATPADVTAVAPPTEVAPAPGETPVAPAPPVEEGIPLTEAPPTPAPGVAPEQAATPTPPVTPTPTAAPADATTARYPRSDTSHLPEDVRYMDLESLKKERRKVMGVIQKEQAGVDSPVLEAGVRVKVEHAQQHLKDIEDAMRINHGLTPEQIKSLEDLPPEEPPAAPAPTPPPAPPTAPTPEVGKVEDMPAASMPDDVLREEVKKAKIGTDRFTELINEASERFGDETKHSPEVEKLGQDLDQAMAALKQVQAGGNEEMIGQLEEAVSQLGKKYMDAVQAEGTTPELPPAPEGQPSDIATAHPEVHKKLVEALKSGNTAEVERHYNDLISKGIPQDALDEDLLRQIGGDDLVSLMQTEEGTVGAGMDRSLLKKLGANLYRHKISAVITKEGIQNAADAARPNKGTIKFGVNEGTRTFTFTDTGIGMSPKVARDEFMDVGGSDKPEGSAGGYGLAKVGLFASAEHIHMVTVAEVGGKKIQTTIEGSSDDWVNRKLKYTTAEVDPGTKTGTVLKIKLNQESSFNQYVANEYYNAAKKYSIGVDFEGKGDLAAEDIEKVKTVDIPEARLEVHQSTENLMDRVGQWDYMPVHILNNGLYQFTINAQVKGATPEFLTINIKPKVDVESDRYAFNTSREEVKGEVKDAVDAIIKGISGDAAQKFIGVLHKVLRESPTVPGTDMKVMDTGQIFDKQQVKDIAKHPAIKILMTRMKDLSVQISNLLEKEVDIIARKSVFRDTSYKRFIFGGVGLGSKYLGINISKEALAEAAHKAGYTGDEIKGNVILVNPFVIFKEIWEGMGGEVNNIAPEDLSRQLANHAVGTIWHEILHESASGHDERFAGHASRALAGVTDRIKDEMSVAWTQAIMHGFFPMYQDVETTWKAGEGKEDVFKTVSTDLGSEGDVPGSPERGDQAGGEPQPHTGGPEGAATPGPGPNGPVSGGERAGEAARREAADFAGLGAERFSQLIPKLKALKAKVADAKTIGEKIKALKELNDFIAKERVTGPVVSPQEEAAPAPTWALDKASRLWNKGSWGVKPNGTVMYKGIEVAKYDTAEQAKHFVDTNSEAQNVAARLDKRLADQEQKGKDKQAAKDLTEPKPLGSPERQQQIDQKIQDYSAIEKVIGEKPLSDMTHKELDRELDKAKRLYDSGEMRLVDYRRRLHEVAKARQALAKKEAVDPVDVRVTFRPPDKMDVPAAKLTEEERSAMKRTLGSMLQNDAIKRTEQGKKMWDKLNEILDYESDERARKEEERRKKEGGFLNFRRKAIKKADVKSLPPWERNISQMVPMESDPVNPYTVSEQFRRAYARIFRQSVHIGQAEKLSGRKLQAHESPYIMAQMANGFLTQTEEYMRGNGPFIPDDQGNFVPTGAMSLAAISRMVGNDVERLGWLAMARRELYERAQNNRTIGINPVDANMMYLHTGQIYHQAADALAEYNHSLVDYSIWGGLVDPKNREKFTTRFYAPIARIFGRVVQGAGTQTVNLRGGGKDAVGGANPIKRYKGSTLPMVNPFETSMNMTARVIRAANQNKVGSLLVGLAKENLKAFQGVLEPASSAQRNKIKADIKAQAIAAKADMGADADNMSLSEIEHFIGTMGDGTLAIRDNILNVWVNGQLEHWVLHPELAYSLKAMSPHELGVLATMAGVPAQVQRFGIVNNPFFILTMASIDTFQAFINSNYGFVPVLSSFKGWWAAMSNSEEYVKYRQGGGGHSSITSRQYASSKTSLHDIVGAPESQAPIDQALHQIKTMHPIEAWRTLVAPVAEAARVGEYLNARGRGASVVESVFAAKDITGNYAQMGGAMHAMNHMTLFMNPGLQVLDKTARVIKDNPARWFLRSSILAVAAMGLYAANDDDEDIRRLRQTQGGQRYVFIRLPDGSIAKMRKPFIEGSIFMSGMEAALDYQKDHDPEHFKLWARAMRQELWVNMLPTIGVIPAQLFANKDWQTGAPIRPDATEDLSPMFQSRAYTGTAARIIGKATNTSPALIEWLTRSQFGMLGSNTLAGLEAVIDWRASGEMPIPEEMPFLKDVLVKYPSSNVKPIRDFYDRAAEIERVAADVEYMASHEPEMIQHYVESHPKEMFLIGQWKDTRKEMSDLRKGIEDINTAPPDVVPPSMKRTYSDEMMKIMIMKAEAANMVYDAANAATKDYHPATAP